MRRFHLCFLALMPLLACNMLGSADMQDSRGELRIAFNDVPVFKSRTDFPDTSDFLITVTGAEGDIVYDGTYGNVPESIMVDSGSYEIFVRSCEFTKPAFDSPQYGQRQCVVVPSGGVADVKLICTQMNSGVRLDIDESFLHGCPDCALFLKSSMGKLMYGYFEERIAYFQPEAVSLMMSSGGTDKVLLTRILQPKTVLTLRVSAASGQPGAEMSEKICVAVDTSRTWMNEDYVIGGDSSDGGGDVLTIAQAKDSVGEEDVWVSGYVVGGDLTSSSASFEPPFFSRTNIVLGPKSSTVSRDACLSVNLSSGNIRESLNLVDNPSLYGRKVKLRGDIVESYYGITGIKNITDYEVL